MGRLKQQKFSKSLRYQINLRIFLSAICILILSGSISIWQAREAINDEVASSINLAVQLIEFSYKDDPFINFANSDWLTQLNSLQAIRHLNIQLKTPSGKFISLLKQNNLKARQDTPPHWFVSLVGSHYPKTEYPFTSSDGAALILSIEANPLDEITEVWQETLIFFISLLLLTLLAFIAVHLTFNQSLRFIDKIVAGLRAIEKGQYQQKLPEFKIREYNNIARAINHMTDELSKAEQEYSALSKHSLDIQEKERQYLAQELHDELGQSLTAIKVMSVTARHPKSDIVHISQSITEICDHLIHIVRTMMYQLHPHILTELGLKAALDDMLKHWKERNAGLSITVDCGDEMDSLPKEMSIHLYRVIQECLTNTVRHAEAQHVAVCLNKKNQLVNLSVTDDGKGCDIDNIKSGFGLRGMQERIKTLGGELKISSHIQQGMIVTATIPYS